MIDLLRPSGLARRWGPVVLWIAGIFYFSSRSNPWGPLAPSRHGIDIDPLAHIIEYVGLAVLLHRALREHGSGGAGEQGRAAEGKSAHNPKLTPAPLPLCTPALIALAYALFDELHQEFIPGRGFELNDIGYDLMAIIATLGFIRIRDRLRRPAHDARRSESQRSLQAD